MRRLLYLLLVCALPAWAEPSCHEVANSLNQRLQPKLDARELADMLGALNHSGNRLLPEKFVTKSQAKWAGWQPGRSLWSVSGLEGKSIGGDRFGNREGLLPQGKWREADLDYKGGKRGAKRLVFSSDGRRMVTVDHYQNFTEVPPCR